MIYNYKKFLSTKIKPDLLQINQVYYQRLFYKTHKLYDYLQSILKQKLFTKVSKNSKHKGLGREI